MFLIKKTFPLSQRLSLKRISKNVIGLIHLTEKGTCYAESYLGRISINNRKCLRYSAFRNGDVVRFKAMRTSDGEIMGVRVRLVKPSHTYSKKSPLKIEADISSGAARVKALKRLYQFHPQDIGLNIEIGLCYLEIKKYDGAFRYFKTALIFDPENSVALQRIDAIEKIKYELDKIKEAEQVMSAGKLLFGH